MQNTCSKKALDGISGCEPKIETSIFWYISDSGCLVTGEQVVTKTCNPTTVVIQCFDADGVLLTPCPDKVPVSYVVPAKCGSDTPAPIKESDYIEMCDDGVPFLRWFQKEDGIPTGVVADTDLNNQPYTVQSTEPTIGACKIPCADTSVVGCDGVLQGWASSTESKYTPTEVKDCDGNTLFWIAESKTDVYNKPMTDCDGNVLGFLASVGCAGEEPPCIPTISSAVASDLSGLLSGTSISIQKPACCMLKVTTSAGDFIVSKNVEFYSVNDFKCAVTVTAITVMSGSTCSLGDIIVTTQK